VTAELHAEGNDAGPEGRGPVDRRFEPPPEGWWFSLSTEVKNLVEKVDSLRADVSANRADFRSEIRAAVDRHERDTQREIERLEKMVEKKADKSDVDPLRNNIRTVVMAVVLTVVMAVVGLVIVNRPPVPSSVREMGPVK
jgi:outer membrane murein-binding lipoprotein Lpp